MLIGLSEPVAVLVDANANAPEFHVCADAACCVVSADWRPTAGVLNNNDYLQVRLGSSASDDTDTSVTTHVGAGAASFTVYTKSFCEKGCTQTDHFTAVSSINGSNDIFRIFLNVQLVGTYSSWEDYHT